MYKLLLTFVLMLASMSAQAATVNFLWEPPEERVDGSTILPSEIAGYTIYENGVAIMWVSGGASSSATYEYDSYGQPCFSISTTDVYQQEGGQSPEVCINVFPAPPMAPTVIRFSL